MTRTPPPPAEHAPSDAEPNPTLAWAEVTSPPGRADDETGDPADSGRDFELHAAGMLPLTAPPPDDGPAGGPGPDAAPRPVAVPGGGRFGDYELVEELARGGMGAVWRARQVSLNREVALKMILSGRFAGATEIARFRAEAEAAATLDHPGIVPIHDVGLVEGHHYFSMKLVEGGTLADAAPGLRRRPREAVRVIAAVADAVHHAHQRGVLHRDLKPGNVLLERAGADAGASGDREPGVGRPVVTDFGLARALGSADAAGETDDGDTTPGPPTSDTGGSRRGFGRGPAQKLTRTGAVMGTPAYMPPEQARGADRLTVAADVYALGAMLYELLTGRPPFAAGTAVDTVLAVLNDPPPPPRSVDPDVPRDLELIVLKCLGKDPARRYATAASLAADLRAWAAGEPVSVRPPHPGEVLRTWVRRNFGRAAWLPAIGLLWGLLSGVAFWLSTAGRGVQSASAAVYDFFPTAPRPWLARLPSPPDWATAAMPVPALVLACGIGLFTAWAARPRGRDADLAAGLVAGVTAGVAAFTFGLGAVALEAVGSPLDAHLVGLAVTSDVPERIEQNLLDGYPGLADVPAEQRPGLLLTKMELDRGLGAPTALAVGMLVCLALFGLLGAAETAVAGPLVRAGTGWAGVLPAYLAFAAPLAVLCSLTVVAAVLRAVWGGSPFLDPLPVAALFATLIAAVLVASHRGDRGGAWGIVRTGLTAAWLGLFVWFVAAEFRAMPAVAANRGSLAEARRTAATQPGDPVLRRRIAHRHLGFANTLRSLGRPDLAIEQDAQSRRWSTP